MAEKVEKSGRITRLFKRISKSVKEIRNELKKVVWLDRRQLMTNLIAVLVICLLFGIVVWAVDTGLSLLVNYTLK